MLPVVLVFWLVLGVVVPRLPCFVERLRRCLREVVRVLGSVNAELAEGLVRARSGSDRVGVEGGFEFHGHRLRVRRMKPRIVHSSLSVDHLFEGIRVCSWCLRIYILYTCYIYIYAHLQSYLNRCIFDSDQPARRVLAYLEREYLPSGLMVMLLRYLAGPGELTLLL